MTSAELELRRRACQEPAIAAQARGMADVAVALDGQLTELSVRPSIERADQLITNLEGAKRAVMRLREALVREDEL